MNKLFKHLAAFALGIALAAGVGLGVSAGSKASEVKADDAVNFTLSSAADVTVSGVTASFAKASGSSAPAWYSAGLRLYANNTFSVSSSSSIIGISINWEKQGSKAFASATADVGTYSHPVAAGVGTWTGSSNKVVFTVSSAGQLQLNTFSVTVGGGEVIDLTDIGVKATEEVAVGSTVTLSPIYTPSNANAKKTISWESLDSSIATVNASTGVVSGVSVGTARIRVNATDIGKSAICTVTVNPVPPVPVTHTIEDLYSISTTGTSVLFNGVYMGHYGTNPFQAIWFADGEYAIAVYGTSTVPSTWEVGKTVVAVSAKTAFYNGLVQVNNASFQLTSATVDTPVVYDFTGTETTANQLSRKVSLSGTVTALSAAITKATDTTVTVTMDNGNAVKIFLKKNVFTDEQIAEYVDTFVVDQYVVVTGFLGYYKSGQTFGSAYNPGDFQVLCPTIVSTEKYTAEKFATDFTDATTPVCSRAESERLTGLQSIWSELSAKYSALDSTERANLVSAEASSNVKNAVARYDYICGKYNTSEHKVLEEFIEGATIVYNSLFVQLSNNNNNAMITTIVITSIASIALLGVTLFIKKRKATH